MSILSLPFLSLSGLSSLLLWIFFGAHFRRYALLACNIAFLYLLHGELPDLVYLGFILLSTWLTAFLLQKTKNRFLLWTGILVPVIGLCFFKYAGYFLHQNILMPLGLSFYTFRAVSYVIDVYKGKAEAKSPVMVFDYICFFPAFLAGPIHRAAPFFEQLEERFTFDYRDQKNGFIQAALGLFEKLVIADALAEYTAAFLAEGLGGWHTLLGIILYSFQIYTDFDAYSNTAVGIARMLGFHLERNFHTPYLACGLRDFWRRWHMSLSSWLRDYVYIPLGGSRKGIVRKWLNTLAVFLVSGIWHGSTLMFLFWGIGHGIFSVLEDMIRTVFDGIRVWKPLRLIAYCIGVIINFCIVSFLWVFFRSGSMDEAVRILLSLGECTMASLRSFDYAASGIGWNEWVWLWVLLAVIILSDLCRFKTDMIEWLSRRNIVLRWVFYFALIVIAVIFGVYGPGYDPQDFIYVTF